VAAIREQHAAGGQVDPALRLDGVLRAVVLVGVIGVVEQRVDRLVALEIDDAQQLAAAHDAHPRFTGRHHRVVHR
jgi:hypothetical protein